jgi:hypothetical protein
VTPLEIIQARAPLFASEPNVSSLIALATTQTGDFGSPDATNTAIALLVCHWYALDKRDAGTGSGIAGSITSESEGELSRSYGSTVGAGARNAALEQTRWGLELLDLRKSAFFLPRTRMM